MIGGPRHGRGIISRRPGRAGRTGAPEEHRGRTFRKVEHAAAARGLRLGWSSKPKQFASIPSVDGVRGALARTSLSHQHPPVIQTIRKGRNRDSFGRLPRKSRRRKYPHAMLIVGYDRKREYIIRNSWGANWGEQGYCRRRSRRSTPTVAGRELDSRQPLTR